MWIRQHKGMNVVVWMITILVIIGLIIQKGSAVVVLIESRSIRRFFDSTRRGAIHHDTLCSLLGRQYNIL